MRALAAFPLVAHGTVFGLFSAYRSTPRPFTHHDLADLNVIRDAVAVVALSRFNATQVARLPHSPVSEAVGLLIERFHLAPLDAVALLRAHAYTTKRAPFQYLQPGSLTEPSQPRAWWERRHSLQISSGRSVG
jgi:hypothetical protein